MNERIRRLVGRGAIRRFTVEADPVALNLGILAFVWVAAGDTSGEVAFRAFATEDARVVECHHVTGEWSFLMKVRLESLAALEGFLAELKSEGYAGRSQAVVALSSPAPDVFVPPAA